MKIHLFKMISLLALMSLLITPASAKAPDASAYPAKVAENNPMMVNEVSSGTNVSQSLFDTSVQPNTSSEDSTDEGSSPQQTIVVTPDHFDTTVVEGFTQTLPLSITNAGLDDLVWSIDEASGQILVDWFDNFDSYPTDSNIHGQGGWKGWFNNPGAGAIVTDDVARSLPNSVDIELSSDLVHEYAGYQTGVWTYTAWQYIPTGYSGQTYFILLNTYNDAGIGLNWSTQVCFDSASGKLYDDVEATCSSTTSLDIVYDQWVEIRVVIDLDTDTQTFYYNDTMLYQDTWTDHVSGAGVLNIAAVDLFANNANDVYYDDVSLVEQVPGPCESTGDIPWLSETPDSGTTLPGETSLVDVQFDATVVSSGTYTGTLCVLSNDLEMPVVPVPVTMTVEAPAYGFDLVPDSSSLSVSPGTYADYTLTLTNTGNVPDTFDLTYAGNDPEWAVEIPVTSLNLDPGESGTVTVSVYVPADALAGESDTVTITAVSQGDPTVTKSIYLTTVAEEVYSASLEPETAAMSGAPGTTVAYVLTLTNTGNITATYDVIYSGNDPAWTVEIPESHFDGVGVGESVSVGVRVSVPAVVGDGAFDTVTISVLSTNDGSTLDSSTLTTTASIVGYMTFLPTIFKP